MIKAGFSFSDDLILRVPALPFRSAISYAEVAALIDDSYFMEALYLASPTLYQQARRLPDLKEGNPKSLKILQSLTKYYLRMSSRSTPFGLFSGCSVSRWSDGQEPITLGRPSRRTRLDMQYLCDLLSEIGKNPDLREQILYFPNTSHYRVGNQIRFAEFESVQGLRHYQLSGTEWSEYLELILNHANTGSQLPDLLALLETKGIAAAEAKAYLNDLVDAQLLVAELEPQLTGKEYIHQLISILERCLTARYSASVSFLRDTLLEINQQLQNLDAAFQNSEDKYIDLVELIRSLDINFDEHKLFQTDLIHHVISGGLDQALQSQLMEAVDILSRISNPVKRHKMARFAAEFSDRYELQEIPLLQVLDPEYALGYGLNKNQHISPLTDRLNLTANPAASGVSKIDWDPLQQWLLSKLIIASRNSAYQVEISAEEVSRFKSHLEDFPSSTSVVFKKIAHENFQLSIEGAGGNSAANLLGRFGHASPDINAAMQRIIEHERQANPEVLFCEIVHLPESRVGNILLRPSCHAYEIPYLANSSKAADFIVKPDELMVSVIDGIVCLRSKKLNRRIIPRLTTAHNSSLRTLPVYEFLCDLQTQEHCAGAYFSWGNLADEFAFLPRLSFKNTILFQATWKLSPANFSLFYPLRDEELPAAVLAFRQNWNMPVLVTLVDGDHELLINLENILSLRTLLSTILKKEKIVLREYLCYASKAVLRDESGSAYANQFVASLLRHQEVYRKKDPARFNNHSFENTIRHYAFGSEWLYYKVYCGIQACDEILLETASVFESLLERGLIDKFFFLRYDDPKPHLRIRMHLIDAGRNLPEVAAELEKSFNPEQCSVPVDQVQIDPYIRELERYGAKNIEELESIFHVDSEAFISFLKEASEHRISTLRWMYALKAIDLLLTDFGMDLPAKIAYLHPVIEAFAAEFRVDKQGRINIDQAYRELRKDINQALEQEGEVDDYPLRSMHSILLSRSEKMIPLIAALQKRNNNSEGHQLIISIIHMTINRVMNTNNRQNEFLLYKHLQKAYISIDARSRKSKLNILL